MKGKAWYMVIMVGLALSFSYMFSASNDDTYPQILGGYSYDGIWLTPKDCVDVIPGQCYAGNYTMVPPDSIDEPEEFIEWLRGLPTFIKEDSLYIYLHADSIGVCDDRVVLDYTQMGDYYATLLKSRIYERYGEK